jgi:NADH-quinone oxidoreductase subunit J
MLLDIKVEERRKIKKLAVGAGFLAVGAVGAFLVRTIVNAAPGAGLADPTVQGATAPLGKLLFTKFLLPFEILSVLLLAAMVGAILLSKRDLR